MKFFAVALAALAATVSAGSYDDETCSVVTATVTVTVPYGVHTPSAPGSAAPTLPPYPTSGAPYPTAPAPSGTGYPVAPSGTAAPSGTGAYTPAPPEFTGAASSLQVGGLLAGAGAIAAFFL